MKTDIIRFKFNSWKVTRLKKLYHTGWNTIKSIKEVYLESLIKKNFILIMPMPIQINVNILQAKQKQILKLQVL